LAQTKRPLSEVTQRENERVKVDALSGKKVKEAESTAHK